MKDSTFIVHSPVPDIPIVLKKPVGETGEKQRCLRSLLNESPNRYASNVSDVQPLGQLKLYYRDRLTSLSNMVNLLSTLVLILVYLIFAAFGHEEDPGLESEFEGTNNKAPKSKSKKGTKNIGEEDENSRALVCVKEDGGEEGRRKEASNNNNGTKVEGFPPKLVAMHRVRWNMNKGSERWLCYGGAAGIVRCQEIAPTSNWKPQR